MSTLWLLTKSSFVVPISLETAPHVFHTNYYFLITLYTRTHLLLDWSHDFWYSLPHSKHFNVNWFLVLRTSVYSTICWLKVSDIIRAFSCRVRFVFGYFEVMVRCNIDWNLHAMDTFKKWHRLKIFLILNRIVSNIQCKCDYKYQSLMYSFWIDLLLLWNILSLQL